MVIISIINYIVHIHDINYITICNFFTSFIQIFTNFIYYLILYSLFLIFFFFLIYHFFY